MIRALVRLSLAPTFLLACDVVYFTDVFEFRCADTTYLAVRYNAERATIYVGPDQDQYLARAGKIVYDAQPFTSFQFKLNNEEVTLLTSSEEIFDANRRSYLMRPNQPPLSCGMSVAVG